MSWNGLSLVNEFANELGDTSTAFKLKVLSYINDGAKDISSSHRWAQMRKRGKKTFASGLSNHSLTLGEPAAPTVALSAGGSLVDGSSYKFLITFHESKSGAESVAGIASASVTPGAGNNSADLSAIPLSLDPLVTSRKVYVSKAGGSYAYHSSINDNTTVIATISTDTSSVVTPPIEGHIEYLDGDLFIEGSRILDGKTLQDFNFQTAARDSSGTPQIWSPVNEEEVEVYPKPSSDTEISFYYYKKPAIIFGTTSSIPELPSFLYEDLRRYVMWRGYDYRDRAGKESKEITYRENLKLTFSRKGGVVKKSFKVRRVTPNSDGCL